MSLEIAIAGTFVRTRTLRSGDTKAVVRTLMGVMSSGNADEKRQATVAMATKLWANNTIQPVLHEIRRVFASKALAEGAEFLGLDFHAPKYDLAVAWMAGVDRSIQGKELKGEKAIYAEVVRQCLALADEKQKAKAAALEAA